MLQRK
ncbi:hypothetical protein HID58_046495 [Brassica napus]